MNDRRGQIADILRRRILADVHLGILSAGDRLPSVRDVAAELHTGGRTVLAAYRDLAGQGLVNVRSRSGIFMREGPAGFDEPLPEVVSSLVEATLLGRGRGVSPADFHHQLRLCLDGAAVRAACVECNHDQIHALSRQVREDYGFDAVSIDLDALRGGTVPPEAVKADLVLTTRFHVAEAQRLGRRLRRPVIVATLDPVFVNTVRAMLQQGRVWWICTDPRFAAKLPLILPGGRFLPLVLGQDPLEAIPPDAMVYATLRASEALPRGWRRGRAVTVRRAFSTQTARALVLFGIRKSLKAAGARARVAARPARLMGISSNRES